MKASSISLTASTLSITLAAALTTTACAKEAQSTVAETEATPSNEYLDAPQTPGSWSYVDQPRETLALYETTEFQALFALRCSPDRTLQMARLVTKADSGEFASERVMRVTAETTSRLLATAIVPGQDAAHMAELDPGDPLFDAIAITKGRFMVEVEGETPLYLPAWVEVGRVIEDCR